VHNAEFFLFVPFSGKIVGTARQLTGAKQSKLRKFAFGNLGAAIVGDEVSPKAF